MIKLILPVAFLMIFKFSNAQNPEKLLQASYAKCLTIKNGYYEMNMKWKFMDSKDTSWNSDNEAWVMTRKLSALLWQHFNPKSEYKPLPVLK